jgi:predicted PurR-regulated permease PerM
VLLASFLAILVDPLITRFERLHVSRAVSAAIFIFLGTILIAALTYVSYKQVSEQIDAMPRYTQRIGQVIAPFTKRIEKVQDSAGRLNAEVPTKKVPEVKVTNNLSWTSYIIRGVGPLSGAAIIAGVVPFLMFFLLIEKESLKQKLFTVWGGVIDVPAFTTKVTQMVRAFVFGNLL